MFEKVGYLNADGLFNSGRATGPSYPLDFFAINRQSPVPALTTHDLLNQLGAPDLWGHAIPALPSAIMTIPHPGEFFIARFLPSFKVETANQIIRTKAGLRPFCGSLTAIDREYTFDLLSPEPIGLLQENAFSLKTTTPDGTSFDNTPFQDNVERVLTEAGIREKTTIDAALLRR